MNGRICDLHTHSTFSDGTFTPTELVEEAKRLGLAVIALTDHNTVDGLPEFVLAGQRFCVPTVGGVEFSVDYEGKELHILGLFIEPKAYEQVRAFTAEYKRKKEESNIALVAALNKAGYAIDIDKIRARTNGQFNRAHVAAELTAQGYVSSIPEAFSALLSKKGGFYKEPPRPSAGETIAFIKDIGALSVLAHPLLNLTESELNIFLYKTQGLVGMETQYSKYDSQKVKISKRIAEHFNLLESGGSDFHGANKPDIQMGSGKGNLRVPTEFYERLKNTL